jgi:hypothetical protein
VGIAHPALIERNFLMSEFLPLLPLLVPSFSSKGNLLIHVEDETHVSDNYGLLQALDIRLSKSYLVSSYDVYYGLMPENPNELPDTDYLFVDSGGYETNDSYDLSERNKFNYNVMPWDVEKMNEVYQRIVSCTRFQNSTVVLSGFDVYGSFEEQLASIQSLAKEFPYAVINFIIKLKHPLDDFLDGFTRGIKHMMEIPILGVTEKELGDTVHERVMSLISMKKSLSSSGWAGHIHVYGGLEPNLVRLYYFAGADIFDGLSWQRVRYRNNSTLYNPSEFIISLDEYENKYLMMIDNLAMLQDISIDLSSTFESRWEKMEVMESLIMQGNCSINDVLTVLEV